MESSELKLIIEGALLAAGRPLSLRELADLFDPMGQPGNDQLRVALDELAEDCESRAYELKEVGSGFRFQVKNKYGLWINRLWEEKPPRYSRALLETLSLVAYKQPLTRGEIEDVRGVAVSTNIIRTLLERGWVRVVGHRDAPGKPAMYATTRQFLDYFNLKNLNELPSLADIKDIAAVNQELALDDAPVEGRSIELPDEEELEAEIAANDADEQVSDAEPIADAQPIAAMPLAEEVGGDRLPHEAEGENPPGDNLSRGEQALELGELSNAADTATIAEAEQQKHEEEELQASEQNTNVPEPADVDPDADFDSLPN